MPLLKRKRVPPIETPKYDPAKKESKETLVWYSPLTQEIFTDYSEYLKRTSLYKKPIWQCEATGKQNLTYMEALKSEREEKERTGNKLSLDLQKQVLLHIQFQTLRLDALVDDTYKHFVNRYVPGEFVQCTWDDNIAYHGQVLEVIKNEDTEEQYKVQLIDEDSVGIEDMIKVLPKEKIKRDRFAFSKNLLKKYIKEHAVKDTYIGAPWNIKPDTAEKFDIDTTLPEKLFEARNVAYAKSRKKRPTTGSTTDHNNGSIINRSLAIDSHKAELTLRYPMEDLNIPTYRRDPSGYGKITDMTPGVEGANTDVQNPTGNMPPHPEATHKTTVPDDCYGSFLMTWSFLSVFAHPLKLSPFSLDDFESALHHKQPSTLMREANIALLNAIIKQRDRLKKESQGSGSTAMAAAMSLYGSGYEISRSATSIAYEETLRRFSSEDDIDENHIWRFRPPAKHREKNPERGCGSSEVEEISRDWDHGTVDTEDEREGWENILIGFINQLAPLEMLDDIDRILSLLVPFAGSTLEDHENAYANLSLRDKIKIFELLISVANESYVIKQYMEECQEQMTELRKQKIELSRERKRIHAERRELDDKQTEENNQAKDIPDESSGSDNDSTASDNDDDSALLKAQRKQEYLTRHESRQAAMKRRQTEREEREAKRLKLHHLQREEARVRNQEQKMRNETRKRLDEEERILHKKEEQVERDLRKYSTHRIKPLGRDKFYNRYYYLDDIGGTLVHGSGRLFVQCPSDTDLIIIQERDCVESIDRKADPPCGRGGGVKFVCQLLKGQGFVKESEYMEQRLKVLNGQSESTAIPPWWQVYDRPEQLDALLKWLNPKGVREFRLKRELEKCYQNIVTGMKKRLADQSSSSKNEVIRRTTRSKTIPTYPPGSWLAYTNKLAYS
ncbi:uncharacterized protein RHIMIDRAFT_277004 [Rhizopus microsporus ATCC 52813]|uniref:DDT domain-containing protein n=1 Tax=Rhizopus microsporus ATCC 52813 TaxID=1340429 RepID=A0A2G4T2Z9_RHIZD|nr:uncharacterized protein RHIMIDRAFT_277004 [Rhizopus microsporus ATCC 52813]PHZ15046.1 hypothetical protein RHIMIDRAFT_277004 [Rhizopus microsporus ATCC 52813]